MRFSTIFADSEKVKDLALPLLTVIVGKRSSATFAEVRVGKRS